MQRTLNLGILAHVDAGKTSLTERLLFDAGVIDHVGRVDDGDTQTDSLELERRRGITIKAAVVSFCLGGTTVNLIDTPGHPDFIAEVERVLGILDGAILVVSAVEGVQGQSRVLYRTLHRLGLPSLIFMNKIDRAGADPDRVLAQVRRILSPDVIAMGTASPAGTAGAEFHPFAAEEMLEAIAEYDEGLLSDYLAGRPVTSARLTATLARLTAAGEVHPVYQGSAITGAGLPALHRAINTLLPAASGDPAAELQAQVFKVDRGPSGERIGYARVLQGRLRTRDAVTMPREDRGRITRLALFDHGRSTTVDVVPADRIAAVHGLARLQVGDWLGRPGPLQADRLFAPPSLETVVVPDRAQDRARLHAALEQLAEQDPLIGLRQDDVRQELYLSLYGEVQKEVIQAMLAEQFRVQARFRQTSTIYIERPARPGAAYELKDAEDNPFLATVGLRIEPAAPGSGVRYQLAVELGSMPLAFMRAVEDTVYQTLSEGLHGWAVTDCLITLTHSGYFPRQSHMGAKFDKSMSSTGEDFRLLTPLVMLAALQSAGTVVCQPIHAFELELPAAAVPAGLSALARLNGIALRQQELADGFRLTGEIPAANVHRLQQQLPGLSHGLGLLTAEFDHYAPLRGPAPRRARTDHNPLDRKEYLLRVQRKV